MIFSGYTSIGGAPLIKDGNESDDEQDESNMSDG